jgi:hypothetical protein
MTVMFTDLVGSVKMYSKVSDTVAVDLVKKLESKIQALLPGLKGKFIKSTGDGQLLTFEEVQGAVSGAKEIHRLCDTLARDNVQEMAVRIACHTGEVFHGDGDIHGNTVNLAARLLSVTGACETSVTAESYNSMSPAEREGFLIHGPEVFKGFNRFSIVYKKPNPNPMTDVTFRPEAMEGDDSSMVVVEAMPKHQAYLVTLEHPQVKKEIPIKEGETHVFGRAPECATVVPDKMFSGTHGALAVNDGILWVFDLQSSNGILYRGRKVKRRKPIRTNDVLQLPTGTLQVKLPPG